MNCVKNILILSNNKLLIFTLGLLLLGCNKEDNGPESRLPNNIVALGFGNNTGNFLMNIDTKLGSTTSYSLSSDLGVVVRYNIMGNKSTGQIDFILFDQSGDSQQIKTLSYDVKEDQFDEGILKVNTDLYYWNDGTSSGNHLVLRGTDFSNIENLFIAIIDRKENKSEVLKICESCSWSNSFSPLLIKNDLLFTLYKSNISYKWNFVVVDLKSKQILYTTELANYPKILIGETDLFMYSADNTIETYNQLNFSKIGSHEFPYDIDLGVNEAIDNKAIVFQYVAQPSPISSIQFVYDLGVHDIVHKFPFEDLISNKQKFEDATGFTLSSIPSLTNIDVSRDFALYEVTQVPEDNDLTNDMAFVYSNYSNDYLGHISLPYQPYRILFIN